MAGYGGNFLNIPAIYINIRDEVCKITAFFFLFPESCYNRRWGTAWGIKQIHRDKDFVNSYIVFNGGYNLHSCPTLSSNEQ